MATRSIFCSAAKNVYAAAAAQQLAPYRLYFNGLVADSGGAGQITLGGPTPTSSPFVQHLELLPRLVRFMNRHPSLSYLFSHDHVGSGGQSVRADERGSDAFDDLQLALACLLRTTVAMLIHAPQALPLMDWGRDLHDRFALPFYLEQDLHAVLAQLTQAGLGLGTDIESELLHDEFRLYGQWPLADGVLEVRRALEFWPLLGDTASPEQLGASRLVDASTARLEIRWRPARAQPDEPQPDGPDGYWRDWDWYAGDIRLPMRLERDSGDDVKVFGLRYRSFAPVKGLHPTLPCQAPLTLTLRHRARATRYTVQLHEWHPLGECYDGLPQSLPQAEARRKERLTISQRDTPGQPCDIPVLGTHGALGLCAYSLDLRYGGLE